MELKIRKAALQDCENIYKWRTDIKNSERSWSGGDFTYNDHEKWFSNYLNKPNHLMLIVHENDVPCCVVRFDGKIDDREVSIYMTPGFHGKKLGLPCLLMGESFLKKEVNGLKCKLHAQVMNDNEASIKLFTKAGYTNSDKAWHKII